MFNHCCRYCRKFVFPTCSYQSIRLYQSRKQSLPKPFRKKTKYVSKEKLSPTDIKTMKQETLIEKAIDSLNIQANDKLCAFGISNGIILKSLIENEEILDTIDQLYIVDHDEVLLSGFHKKYCKNESKIQCIVGDALEDSKMLNCNKILSQLPNSLNIDFMFNLISNFNTFDTKNNIECDNNNNNNNVNNDNVHNINDNNCNEKQLTKQEKQNAIILCNHELNVGIRAPHSSREYSRLAVSLQLCANFQHIYTFNQNISKLSKKFAVLKMSLDNDINTIALKYPWIWDRNHEKYQEWVAFQQLCFGPNKNKILFNVLRDSNQEKQIKIDNLDNLEKFMCQLNARYKRANGLVPMEFCLLFDHIMGSHC